MRGGSLPNPRTISHSLHRERAPTDASPFTTAFMQFGQFIDHDMTAFPLPTGDWDLFSAKICCLFIVSIIISILIIIITIIIIIFTIITSINATIINVVVVIVINGNNSRIP